MTRDRSFDAASLREEIARRGIPWLLQVLRLDGSAKREGAESYKVLCPWHGEDRPSCQVRLKDDAVQAHCFSCGQTGTALDLWAAVDGLTLPAQLDALTRRVARELGLEHATTAAPALAVVQPKAGRPPVEEVAKLWADCRPASADPGDLRARGLDPAAVEGEDLARLLPEVTTFPRWASCRRRSWAQSGHRWILPLYDERGRIVSLHARVLQGGSDPKALSPAGCELKGLVLADARGVALLQTGKAPLGGVVICEGVPDLLTLGTLWSDGAEDAPAVLGIIAGCWTRSLAQRIPKGAQVTIWTHSDRGGAGQKYARQILATLDGRTVSVVTQEIAEGAKKAPDANDLLKSGGAAAVLAVLQSAGAPEEDWRDSLILNAKGGLTKGAANVVTILGNDPAWRGVLAFNEFARRVEARKAPPWHRDDAPRGGAKPGPWVDDDDTRVCAWLERNHGLQVGVSTVTASVRLAAQQQGRYHPVRDYLSSVRWDGVPRLAGLFRDYFGAQGAHLPLVSVWWPVSAVARAFEPGCQVDHTVILEGSQSLGKSSALRALCADEEWYFSSHIDLKNKDAMVALEGAWLVCIEEFAAFKKAEQEDIKSYLTERVDRYRPPYGRSTVRAPRSCAFCATTNASQYLEDPSGGRRFWPVAVTHVALEELRRDRDQLWAEAVHLYRAGQRFHPATLEEIALLTCEQDQRFEADPWEGQIAAWLADLTNPRAGVALQDVLEKAIGLRLEQHHRGVTGRAAAVLRRLKWTMRLAGHRRARLWFPEGC